MKKILIFTLIISIILIVGCGSTTPKKTLEGTDQITFTTSDGFTIKGKYYESNSSKSIILIHQLDSNKEIWNSFALELKEESYNVIAIDLRGHGSSEGEWKDLNTNELNNMVLDVKEAAKFLREKNPGTKIGIIGASIGANVAINYGATNEIDGVILLSPGLDYRGIKTDRTIRDLKKPILIISGNGDRYAYESSIELERIRNRYQLPTDNQFYLSNLHGTTLLGNRANSFMISWLNSNL